MKKALFLVASLLLLVTLACGFNASTANIASAIMAHDAEGNDPTTVFAQDEVFYAVVELANAPDDTNVKAVWTAVEADGTDPNLVIDEVEVSSGSGGLHFDLTNDKLWPVGKYKVDLYLNDELDRTLEFEVEGEVAAAPESEATPESEPTATPEPTPTAQPTPTNTPMSSAGDTLSGSGSSGDDTLAGETEEEEQDEEQVGAEPLPFQPEPYVHSSGAFSFAMPVAWESINDDETSVLVGDDLSRVGVVFVTGQNMLDEKQFLSFIDESIKIIIGDVDENYEVIAENNLLDEEGFVYVATSFAEGEGQADFFFDRQDTVVFIFYFISLVYDEMEPTWDAIIESYQIDAEAAKAAAPVATPTPIPTPTPRPAPPTPTPQPSTNQFAPPSGQGRVYLVNSFTHEFNIDFGDGSGSIQVPPGAEDFYHDIAPGNYRPGLSVAGGNAINIELNIGADQSWVIMVDEGGSVRTGQIYP